jgi:hypothetical protein
MDSFSLDPFGAEPFADRRATLTKHYPFLTTIPERRHRSDEQALRRTLRRFNLSFDDPSRNYSQ